MSAQTETSSAPAPAVADPGPLGLSGFALTTLTLSVYNAQIIKPASLSAEVLPLALFYGGIAQLLAGMWEFKNKNTFGALAFSSYGSFWLSFYWYVKYIAGSLPAASAHEATGMFLLAWTIFTLYMMVASFKTSGAIVSVFVVLVVTFILLTIGAFGNSTGITQVGGYFGILTALLAWYASFAGVTNATWKRAVIPVWPLS